MSLRRKGSAPWSLTKDTGLSDAPVSGSPFVEGDEVKPVIDAGYIDASGLWQINPSNDLAFTFQDPDQALAINADMEFPINMLNHDMFILAALDTSGNTINVDFFAKNPTTLSGPYAAFAAVGVNGSQTWRINKNVENGELESLLYNGSSTLAATWQFYKVIQVRGTQIRLVIHNNSQATGTISTAYMRMV